MHPTSYLPGCGPRQVLIGCVLKLLSDLAGLWASDRIVNSSRIIPLRSDALSTLRKREEISMGLITKMSLRSIANLRRTAGMSRMHQNCIVL